MFIDDRRILDIAVILARTDNIVFIGAATCNFTFTFLPDNCLFLAF